MSDRPADRPVPPLVCASARKRAYTVNRTNDWTNAERSASRPDQQETRSRAKARTGTLGGSNRMLSARDVAAILAVPERTVRDKWREWGLPAYRIGKTPTMERTRRIRLDRPPGRMNTATGPQPRIGAGVGRRPAHSRQTADGCEAAREARLPSVMATGRPCWLPLWPLPGPRSAPTGMAS